MDSAILLELDSLLTRVSQAASQQLFLNDNIGESFIGLHRLPESPKELAYHWTFPANVGNTDPAKKTPHGPHNWVPGDPALFQCQGTPGIEDNSYAYMVLPVPSQLPSRVFDVRTFQIADLAGWQALEWQFQLTMAGFTHNCAFQFQFPNKQVRIFDYVNKKWNVVTGVDFPDFTQPVTFVCEFSLTIASTTHEAISINGKRYQIGIKQFCTDSQSSKFSVSFQADPQMGKTCTLNILQTDLRYVI